MKKNGDVRRLELYEKNGLLKQWNHIFDKEILLYKDCAENFDDFFYYFLEEPELMERAARWFNSKWGVPKEAYLECMKEYLSGETEYGWYLWLDGDKIVGGMRVITDHIGFYERYGWEFFCMAQGDGEPDMTRLYIHR